MGSQKHICTMMGSAACDRKHEALQQHLQLPREMEETVCPQAACGGGLTQALISLQRLQQPYRFLL